MSPDPFLVCMVGAGNETRLTSNNGFVPSSPRPSPPPPPPPLLPLGIEEMHSIPFRAFSQLPSRLSEEKLILNVMIIVSVSLPSSACTEGRVNRSIHVIPTAIIKKFQKKPVSLCLSKFLHTNHSPHLLQDAGITDVCKFQKQRSHTAYYVMTT